MSFKNMDDNHFARDSGKAGTLYCYLLVILLFLLLVLFFLSLALIS